MEEARTLELDNKVKSDWREVLPEREVGLYRCRAINKSSRDSLPDLSVVHEFSGKDLGCVAC